jgi:hypothetical protein
MASLEYAIDDNVNLRPGAISVQREKIYRKEWKLVKRANAERFGIGVISYSKSLKNV